MLRHLIILVPLLLLSFLQGLVAQVNHSGIRVFSGKIIDDSLAFALPSVHVWNESTRMGTVSNDAGEFRIRLRDQDTLVFSALGYKSAVMVVSPSMGQLVRMEQTAYEIDEVVVRRFRSYQSFIYEVVHHDLPESEIAELKEYVTVMSTAAALEADRERAAAEKLETGRFGYITPLGRGIDREKAFREKMALQEKRKEVILAKFNRDLVGEITQLDGDELTEFIAYCNFSEAFLYESDLYTIVENLYAKLDEYQNSLDTIPSFQEH